jgi:ATP-dependent RNA helicase DeaD
MSLPDSVLPALAQALAARGYEALTPVQEAVIAPELAAADLIVSAQTGSGKTVAFGLAMAEALLQGRGTFERSPAPLALVIAPTRELALQVKRELEWLYAVAGGRVVSCVGGMDARDERRALEAGCHIVVGTPGRLSDHIRRGALVMSDLKAVVLDEADEMLNLGFREELEHILDASPAERRTLMFSATMPKAMEALARKYQRDAQRVNTVSKESQHIDIEYRAVVAARHETENAVFNLLRYHDATNALVFCATRAAVTRLTSRLTNRGYNVVALSGELSQAERTHALQALRDHRAQVCVATDVAARGIDLPDLELVIHADLPKNVEGLVHRSGRTGRAGRKGVSVLIVPHPARRQAERLLRDAKIEARWGEPPSPEDVKKRDDKRLLADPILSEAALEAEEAIVKAVLEKHGPEQIAAAFVRLYRKGKAAPEEIAPAPPETAQRAERTERKSRDDFADGVWVSLSVGRAQAAEPRWLIPMICRIANLTKADLGAIRIHDRETHVEFTPHGARAFFDAIGPDGLVEKNIVATALDGAPAAQSRAPRRTPPRRDEWRPEGRPEPRQESRHEVRHEPRSEPRQAFRLEERSEPRPENRADRRARAFGKPTPAEPILKAKPRSAHKAKNKTFDGKGPPKRRPAEGKKHK